MRSFGVTLGLLRNISKYRSSFDLRGFTSGRQSLNDLCPKGLNLIGASRSSSPAVDCRISDRFHCLVRRGSTSTGANWTEPKPKTAQIPLEFKGSNMDQEDKSQYIFPNNQPVVLLECQQAFCALSDKEKLYAHYMARASWYGGLIVLIQTSPESPLIFILLQKLYSGQDISELKEIALSQCDFSEDEFQALLVYSSGIYTNMGNYKGFGDSKFIPNLPKEKFETLLKASSCYQKNSADIERLWQLCSNAMYSLEKKNKQLGLPGQGMTTYFSSNCKMKDAEFINKFMKAKGIDAYNTRLFKLADRAHGRIYEVRLASALTNDDERNRDCLGTYDYEGAVVQVTRGDYSALMKLVYENLSKAKEYASNETERNMLCEYVRSFTTGSLPAHKTGSRYWIQDKGPIIETYIGFIETYRDPVGQRGEFEGFVAMVNKKMSAKFAELVEKAEQFLPLLPWPPTYEKDKFLRPDFTSLDVLAFAGSGVPAGINIPNYDEIRQSEGFKNVSLGNVIPASYKDTVTPFLSSEDQELLNKYRVGAFEVQVGLHELLGHGSGKLFVKDKSGNFNFDWNTINPETGERVIRFYEPGDTYDSVFTTVGSSYEECRAECVGLYLSLNYDVLRIFGYEGETAEDIIYVNWLSLLWAGLRGLEMYQPEHNQWGQAHSQARYVILQVLLEAGEGLVDIKETTGSDGNPDLLLTLDRQKIKTVGKDAIGNFLRKLQIYKSTADIENARNMFAKYSVVAPPGGEALPFLSYRSIVIARRQPRKMLVQVNTVLEGDKVDIKTYDATHEGLIKSWIDRFPNNDIYAILEELFDKDRSNFDF